MPISTTTKLSTFIKYFDQKIDGDINAEMKTGAPMIRPTTGPDHHSECAGRATAGRRLILPVA